MLITMTEYMNILLMFCILQIHNTMNDCKHSILQVCGYRLRLHFDGYLSCYDFWTNAGSPDIHPIGWCGKTKHELHIPKGKQGWKESEWLFQLYFNNIS